MSCPVIELTQQLIRRPSLSPDDAGCQALMIERLRKSVLPLSIWILATRKILGMAWAWRNAGVRRAY